jgi:hypothetical protein
LVRDPLINNTEQLRAYLAKFPDAAEFDQQRQTTLVPKGVVYGLASILPLVSGGNRPVEVTLLDEFQLKDIRDKDIIYIGPLVRLGPLGDHFFRSSRYEFDVDSMRLTDSVTHKSFELEGVEERITDHGLFATFPGPSRNPRSGRSADVFGGRAISSGPRSHQAAGSAGSRGNGSATPSETAGDPRGGSTVRQRCERRALTGSE